jgi:fructose-1,6-bisphosphatase II
MERNLGLELVRATEMAAISSARWMGLGNPSAAEQAAIDAMRHTFDSVSFRGSIVIGKGEHGKAPTLYVGEVLGRGDAPEVDIALDAVESGAIVAHGRPNAISVIAAAEKGSLRQVPEAHMEKIAVGPKAAGVIDITAPPEKNLRAIAEAMNCSVEEITVVILDRPRHADLVKQIRGIGARIKLIQDGDLSATVAVAFEGTGVDVLMGVGGAREGALAATALQCIGGDMQGRLKPLTEEEADQALRMGIRDLDRVFTISDLSGSGDLDIMFAATGVTDGDLLKGVRFFGGGAQTHSLVMRSRSATVRFIESTHRFDRKAVS